MTPEAERVREQLARADCPPEVLTENVFSFPHEVLASPALPLLSLADPCGWMLTVSRARFGIAVAGLRGAIAATPELTLRRFREFVRGYLERAETDEARADFQEILDDGWEQEGFRIYGFAAAVFRHAAPGGRDDVAGAHVRAEALEGLLAYVRDESAP